MHEDGSSYICADCASRYYTRCRECGRYFIPNGSSKCHRCSNDVYTKDINSYGTKPIPVFKNIEDSSNESEKNKRYYGLEMEFNYTDPHRVRMKAKKLYNNKYLYNKADSSIYSGVEVVTSPLDKGSVEYVLNNFEKSFEYIRNNENYTHNAGIHIHVNRKSIHPMVRYKLFMLLNNKMSIKDKNMLYYLSGRVMKENLSLGKIEVDDHYYTAGKGTINYKKSSDRYQAINVNNYNTFEFRLFKSIADKDTILSYVELVDTMVDFCGETGVKNITIANYIIYLKNKCRNNIILDKIKYFEEKFGEFKNESILVDTTKLKELLARIKWYQYYKLLSVAELSSSSNSTSELVDSLTDVATRLLNGESVGKLDFKIFSNNTTSRSSIVKDMIEELRKNLVNKIIKRKENKKCA